MFDSKPHRIGWRWDGQVASREEAIVGSWPVVVSGYGKLIALPSAVFEHVLLWSACFRCGFGFSAATLFS